MICVNCLRGTPCTFTYILDQFFTFIFSLLMQIFCWRMNILGPCTPEIGEQLAHIDIFYFIFYFYVWICTNRMWKTTLLRHEQSFASVNLLQSNLVFFGVFSVATGKVFILFFKFTGSSLPVPASLKV